MFDRTEYELVDFGGGRKLERFGPYLLDRPAPAAEGLLSSHPDQWREVSARFERTDDDHGDWLAVGGRLPARWTIRHDQIRLELKTTPVGHLGVFPEQAANWDWLKEQIAMARPPLTVLNLFAYTGASSLVAAAAGAAVVHVDAVRNTVAWARRNAALSGLAAAPIRWITDDAATFVRRELKRGNRYHAIILDPPSYGHGGKRQVWKLVDDLAGLLADCVRLLDDDRCLMLLTCHTPGYGPNELRTLLADAGVIGEIECGPLLLTTSDGRSLPSGAMARISSLL